MLPESAAQLTAEFGRGFSAKTLRHMMHFAEAFSDTEIVSSVTRQLTWTHFLEIMYIKDRLKREFYTEMCRLVAIELKLDKFTAAYKGQMELYLRWTDRYERRSSQVPP